MSDVEVLMKTVDGQRTQIADLEAALKETHAAENNANARWLKERGKVCDCKATIRALVEAGDPLFDKFMPRHCGSPTGRCEDCDKLCPRQAAWRNARKPFEVLEEKT